jgi:hypothetical protein
LRENPKICYLKERKPMDLPSMHQETLAQQENGHTTCMKGNGFPIGKKTSQQSNGLPSMQILPLKLQIDLLASKIRKTTYRSEEN